MKLNVLPFPLPSDPTQILPDHALEVIKIESPRPYQENNISQICIKAAIQFAESNAVGISNEYLQISKCPDMNNAFFTALWERDKPIQWAGLALILVLLQLVR